MKLVNGALAPAKAPYTLQFGEIGVVSDLFCFNKRRASLWESYVNYTTELRQLVKFGFTQWIDGSFVTFKPIPQDIDIVTFVQTTPDKYAMFFAKHANLILRYPPIDSYMVFLDEGGVPIQETQIGKEWNFLFSRRRLARNERINSGTLKWKGFVEILVP